MRTRKNNKRVLVDAPTQSVGSHSYLESLIPELFVKVCDNLSGDDLLEFSLASKRFVNDG